MQGVCSAQDRALPLAPFLDVLRTLLLSVSQDEYLAQIAPFAPELIKILPDLALWLPEVRPTPALEPEQEKRRLFTALASFLLGLSKQGPILLILEDLHWSDEISLEFLLFLTRQLGDRPLLLLLTYRSNEVQLSLQRFLAALNRERAAVEFALAALNEEEVHELLRQIFQMRRPVHRTFLKALYSLTEGNPFFVEEVLKSLLATGDIFFSYGIWDRKPLDALHIPGSIAAAVQQRLSVLSEAAREMLALAAVIGRKIDFTLLQVITQRPLDELLSFSETAITAQLLVEAADGQLAFRHVLTQQAVYEGLLVSTRKALHLKIGQTMESLYVTTLQAHFSELAYHFYQAEAWSQALDYEQKVGERTFAQYLPYAAVEHYTHALEAAAHLEQLPEVRVLQLYRLRGKAQEYLGNFAAAQSDFEQALKTARVVEDHEAELQLLLILGSLWTERDYARAGDYIQRSLELAQELADPQKYVRSKNRLAYWLTNTGQPALASEMHEEALQIFQAQGRSQQVALTLDYLALALAYRGDMLRSVACSDQALALLRAAGNKRSFAICLSVRCSTASLAFSETVFGTRTSLARCQQDVEEIQALADSIEWPAGQALAHFLASLVFTSSGLLGPGLAHARLGLVSTSELDNPQGMAGNSYALGATQLLMLDPLAAISTLEAGLTFARSLNAAFWIGMIVSVLAQAYLLTGDLPRTAATLVQVLSYEQNLRNLQERRILRVWSELALAQQKPELALHLADVLLASVPGEAQTYPIPALWKLRGESFYALGHIDDAVRLLEEAEAEAHVQGALPLLWQIQRSLGRIFTTDKQKLRA